MGDFEDEGEEEEEEEEMKEHADALLAPRRRALS